MWPFRRKSSRPAPTPPAVVELPPQEPDDPFGFGYKNTWWAVPSVDMQAVVTAFGLQNSQPANWRSGIANAYDRSVFVTPAVDGWTLVTGFELPPSNNDVRREVAQPLEELSQTFGEAQVFSTHRIVDYHVWAKAVQGKLIRGYGYLGESGETLWNAGDLTPEEQSLGIAFVDERSLKDEEESYWERDDIQTASEDDVMNVARAWSVAPCDFKNYKPRERKLGILGSHSELFTRFFP
ncbi:hypothetical protein Pan97_52260 [Bremerella volcania]|uniref:Uncharacterized protein n=1 Tax=Bremerella volcania TaxID=2527984 RepID=A0A518CG50_9BACT|nr:DUF3597 domain-containing protein [Bremerella volcania]QDU78144.1 hypothetical protein Pan97_52260 [Bremerella volcania]